jgi:hypothetical protein
MGGAGAYCEIYFALLNAYADTLLVGLVIAEKFRGNCLLTKERKAGESVGVRTGRHCSFSVDSCSLSAAVRRVEYMNQN